MKLAVSVYLLPFPHGWNGFSRRISFHHRLLTCFFFCSIAGHSTRTPLDMPLSRLGVLENLHMVGPYPPTPQQSYAHMLGSVRTLDPQPTDLSVYTTGQMRDIKVFLVVLEICV